MKLRVRKPEAVSWPTPQVPYPIGDELPNSCPQISQMNADKEQAGNNFPEFSQSRTKLWQRLLTLPPRRPKDRSPTWTPAGNLRSGSRRSGKTGWGHPPCSTNVSLWRIHFHRYWTGVRFRLVEISEVSAALNAPVGLPIFCHKVLLDKDKHPSSRPCSDSSQSFPSLSLGSTGSFRGGSAQGPLTL